MRVHALPLKDEAGDLFQISDCQFFFNLTQNLFTFPPLPYHTWSKINGLSWGYQNGMEKSTKRCFAVNWCFKNLGTVPFFSIDMGLIGTVETTLNNAGKGKNRYLKKRPQKTSRTLNPFLYHLGFHKGLWKGKYCKARKSPTDRIEGLVGQHYEPSLSIYREEDVVPLELRVGPGVDHIAVAREHPRVGKETLSLTKETLNQRNYDLIQNDICTIFLALVSHSCLYKKTSARFIFRSIFAFLRDSYPSFLGRRGLEDLSRVHQRPFDVNLNYFG